MILIRCQTQVIAALLEALNVTPDNELKAALKYVNVSLSGHWKRVKAQDKSKGGVTDGEGTGESLPAMYSTFPLSFPLSEDLSHNFTVSKTESVFEK